MADTIFALATGTGRAAIAIIRLSGPAAAPALRRLAGMLPPPRQAVVRRLRDATGAVLDQAVVLWFPGPRSATGEDMAEAHVHGGRAVVAAVLSALGAQPGCRPALPGEFTRRAFLNGRLDLGAVEGLADLIDAETEAQRRQAMRQLDGALGRWVAAQRARLLQALAAAESAIDFSDEGDVAGDFTRELRSHASLIQEAIHTELRDAPAAARIRDGVTVALAGPPNAGKSTLLNALARRDAAIVSPTPGTTRDPVVVPLDLQGYRVELVDTAGLRESEDAIEREGVARAIARAKNADLVLWLSDVRDPCPPDPALQGVAIWRVATKVDLLPPRQPADFDYTIAAPSGEGLVALVEALTHFAGHAGAEVAAVTTRARHRVALVQAAQALAPVVDSDAPVVLELAAEQLRTVAALLDSLIGRIAPDDVLGEIFERFCIGK